MHSRAHLASQPDFNAAEHWLYGMGWDQTTLGLGAFPTAADLDVSPALAAVPVALLRVDVHAVWLNGAALARLGTLPSTVPGGEIIRDAAGEPTGILMDDAMDLVLAVAAMPAPAKVAAALDDALLTCAANGLTAVHEAGMSESMRAIYKARIDAGRFPLRNFAMVTCAERNTFCPLDRLDDYGNGRLTARKYGRSRAGVGGETRPHGAACAPIASAWGGGSTRERQRQAVFGRGLGQLGRRDAGALQRRAHQDGPPAHAPRAARTVGAAVGRRRISSLDPCDRRPCQPPGHRRLQRHRAAAWPAGRTAAIHARGAMDASRGH